jgi:hypothetical protein
MSRGIAIAVALVFAGFLVLHAGGARAYAGFLSGNVAGELELVVGVVYVLAWFAAILVVPIATLALILDAVCVRIVGCSRRR